MDTIYVKKGQNVKKAKAELERSLNIKLTLEGNMITFEGAAVDEYVARQVLEAMAFGFSASKALLLKDEEMAFRIVHIKDHTKRNLEAIRSRVIGTRGKTRRTISDITGCDVLITDTDIGIIGHVEDAEDTERAFIQIIRGMKQSNAYQYLEKRNKEKKETTSFDDLLN